MGLGEQHFYCVADIYQSEIVMVCNSLHGYSTIHIDETPCLCYNMYSNRYDKRMFISRENHLSYVVIVCFILCFREFNVLPSIDSTRSFVYNSIIGSEHIKIISILKGTTTYE